MKSKWMERIVRHATEFVVDAAAYNEAALILHKDFANLNELT
jgi:hypothetical protein